MTLINELDKSKLYLVAVSGGADSMALLDMLVKHNFILHVVCVNYKTRISSDFEQNIIEHYCISHELPYSIHIAKKHQKGNFENYAREVRYNFFKHVYKEKNASGLFIGHHLDDHLETYLMQKKRNNIVEYYGIKPITEIMQMRVIRPLLEMSKADIINYCQKEHIAYHDDESNVDEKYLRNKIRHQILSSFSNKMKQELKEHIIEENHLLALKQKEYAQANEECIINNKIDLTKFNLQELDSKINLLYNYLKNNILDDKINLTKVYLIDIINQLQSSNVNLSFPIGKNYLLIKEYSSVFFSKKLYNTIYKYVLNENDTPLSPYFHLSNMGNPFEGVYIIKEDYPLVIRPFESGDRVRIKDGYKKVSRFFIDLKIPKSKREIYPLLINSKGEVLLIPKIVKTYSRHNLKDNFFINLNREVL